VLQDTALPYCPDCLAWLDVSRIPDLGQEVTCGGCSVILRVFDLNPLQIDWAAEEIGEDWEEDSKRVQEPQPRP
jgi:lysine biosynthesis protein LysW